MIFIYTASQIFQLYSSDLVSRFHGVGGQKRDATAEAEIS